MRDIYVKIMLADEFFELCVSFPRLRLKPIFSIFLHEGQQEAVRSFLQLIFIVQELRGLLGIWYADKWWGLGGLGSGLGHLPFWHAPHVADHLHQLCYWLDYLIYSLF